MVSTLGRNQRNIRSNIKQLIREYNRSTSVLLPYIPPEFAVNSILVKNLNDFSITSPNSGMDDRTFEDNTIITLPNDNSIIENGFNNSNDSYNMNVDDCGPSTMSLCDENIDELSVEEDDIIVLDVEEFEISRDCSSSESEDLAEQTAEICNVTNLSRMKMCENNADKCSITDIPQTETAEETTEYNVTNPSYIETSSPVADFSNVDEVVIDHFERINDLEIPGWFIRKFRRGLISPTIINILNFQRIFIPSQSEDYFSRPSHELCYPILQFIVGIVLGDDSEASRVQCHARIKNMQLGVFHIEPVFEVPSIGHLPTLRSVSNLSLESRMNILLGCLGIPKTTDLNIFPEEWRLYMITLMYWRKNCQQCTVNGSHLRALFLCFIHLSVIDCKIGFARCASDLKKLRKNIKKETEAVKIEEDAFNCNIGTETSSGFKNRVHTDFMKLISEKDCFKAADALLHYHQMDPNLLKDRKQFNVKLVHAFAQLQHCIQNIMLLNCVLDFPFYQYKPHLVFSGTFLYNFYLELHNRKLADGYITRTLLAKANSIISLYRYLITSWETCISFKEGRPEVKKKKTRKRKSKSACSNQTQSNECDDEEYQDPDNIFSLLPME